MLRPVKAVRVTTKEALDAALATADQITVDGDDELLSYAVNKAAGDPENRVAVQLDPPAELGGPQGARLVPTGTVKWFNSQKGYGFIAPDQGGPDAFVHISAVERAGLRDLREGQKVDSELVSDRKNGKMSADNLKVHSNPGDPLVDAEVAPEPAAAAAKSSAMPIMVGAGVAALAFVGGLGYFLIVGGTPSSTPTVAVDGAKFHWDNMPSMLWPLVAIVAIVALFLIARQAISSGSNVTITWKVTEKVTGRVVITKVRDRAPGKRAA
jgi:cold shock protein